MYIHYIYIIYMYVYTHVYKHIYICTHSNMWHNSFTSAIWFIQTCDMTLSHVRHDSFTCVTWLIHQNTLHNRLIHVYGKTHSYVWHDSFIRVHKTVDYWLDAFTCAPWLMHMCNITHRSECTQSISRTPLSIWLIHTCAMTQCTHE